MSCVAGAGRGPGDARRAPITQARRAPRLQTTRPARPAPIRTWRTPARRRSRSGSALRQAGAVDRRALGLRALGAGLRPHAGDHLQHRLLRSAPWAASPARRGACRAPSGAPANELSPPNLAAEIARATFARDRIQASSLYPGFRVSPLSPQPARRPSPSTGARFRAGRGHPAHPTLVAGTREPGPP